MPQLVSESTAGRSQTDDTHADYHDSPRFPPVAEGTGQRSHQPINKQVQREHYGGTATAPAEFVQYRWKEYRKGVPGTVNQSHAEDGGADDYPSVEKR